MTDTPVMRRRPTIVFDLDGTLVDTAHDLIGALNAVVESEGMAPVDFDTAVVAIGHGAKAMLHSAMVAEGRSVTDDRLDALATAFIAYYAEHIADRSLPFPGVEPMLDRFGAAGWQHAVCTNKLERLARRLLDRLELTGRFAAIAGQDTFGVKKPDPRHLTETIRAAGGATACAIMVGDSSIDVDTARAVGVPVIVVEFGYSPVPAAELGADAAIDHFDQLWDAVQSLMPRIASP